MPIIVDRATGQRIDGPTSQETCSDMMFAVFQAFCSLHPDIIREEVEKYQNNSSRH